MTETCLVCGTLLRPGYDARPRCPLFGGCGRDPAPVPVATRRLPEGRFGFHGHRALAKP